LRMRRYLAPLLALALSACATAQKLDAANDVHTLLVAIRDNDRATFDAYVDKPALKYELSRRLAAEAGKDKRLGGLGAILAPAVADLAGDALIRPDVFRTVAEHYGYSRNLKIPNAIAISTLLRRLPDGRVCAVGKKDGPCELDFTKAADGHWRLSGFEGDTKMLRVKL
jgi:hypothetical protein